MAKLTIDGKELDVADGSSLFDACATARGEDLPHFCYHPDLSVAGVCRLCQVEVEGMPKLTIACNTAVRDGMVVHTRNKRVSQASQQILEMHLINHPVDCPICDQAGECGLQDQYMNFGLYDSEVVIEEKVNKAKAEVIGPQVILDKERCVLCTRCVRFCDEVTGTSELGIFNRGNRAEIGTAPGVELDNNYSLNTVDICPVGALTSRDFRFQKRVWMLKGTESVCAGCATGCNVRIDHEGGRIYRMIPRRNEAVNGAWMCDSGRMTYKGVHDESRMIDPQAKGATARWADLQGDLQGMLADGLGLVITSAHQSLEEMFMLKTVAGEAKIIGGLAGSDMDTGDELLLNADRTPNRSGLAMLDLHENDGATMAATISGTKGTVLIHGGNPASDSAVASAITAHGRVIYIGTHNNETAQLSSVVLPGATWAEKAGIFANKDGRLQSLKQSVARPGSSREDWRILSEMIGAEGPSSLKAVREALAESLNLGEVNLNKLPSNGLATNAVPAGGNS
ncbi:MAG: NADH-quinone oxidoreductase subunit G [Candidatus Krumholzibacteriia bacterium]|jgi:NADH-quinone oxidoreductase subunit G